MLVVAERGMLVEWFISSNVILQVAKVGTTEVWLRLWKRDVSGHMSFGFRFDFRHQSASSLPCRACLLTRPR
jgi:hypothetical protein